MKWLGRRQSGNIDDRRGFSGGGIAAGGGILGLVVYLLFNFLGGDSSALAGLQGDQGGAPQGVTETRNSAEDEMARFASVMLADNEDVWNKIFAENGKQYQEPVMVLFNERTGSACGTANSATGPFYCPADQKVYLDLSFFNDLKNKFGANGDFANAYVIAHEVGHHVQQLLGTSGKVQQAMEQSPSERNKLSVALELQADFYAGLWAHYNQEMKNTMDAGDLEEALSAANAIGDDRLQKMSTGEVVPDAFTHGTSAQRMFWFKKGFESGDIRQGNTFAELR